MEYDPEELLTGIMWMPAVPLTFRLDTDPDSRFLTSTLTVPREYWKQATTLESEE